MSDRIAQEYADGATNRVNGWTYDANGNVTAMPGGTAFNGVYDIENRLVEASRNAAVKYGYGADNRRIFESKRVGGEQRRGYDRGSGDVVERTADRAV